MHALKIKTRVWETFHFTDVKRLHHHYTTLRSMRQGLTSALLASRAGYGQCGVTKILCYWQHLTAYTDDGYEMWLPSLAVLRLRIGRFQPLCYVYVKNYNQSIISWSFYTFENFVDQLLITWQNKSRCIWKIKYFALNKKKKNNAANTRVRI